MSAEKFDTYLFDYYHNGSWWSLNVPATSREDALERIKIIGNRARFVGTLEMTIPAMHGTGWIPRLICWWKNRKREVSDVNS